MINVRATATINTFFLGLLSGYKTLNIDSSAQATRPKLIMSLVLGRSGSMNLNGGAQALPPAVDNFLTYFDNNNDQVAMVSFSSTARVDVPIQTGFTGPITTAEQNGLRRRHVFASGIAGRSGSDQQHRRRIRAPTS